MGGHFYFRPDGDNLALPDEDGPIFDDPVGHDQGAAQGIPVSRRLREERTGEQPQQQQADEIWHLSIMGPKKFESVRLTTVS